MQSNKIEITQYSIGDSFSKYERKNATILNAENCYDYGVGPRFNLFYEEDTTDNIYFIDRKVKKVAFNVLEDQIHDLTMFLDISDIDNFYFHMEEIYGTAETTRISQRFFEKHGYKNPSEIDTVLQKDYYSNLPQPEVSDYKILGGIAWYNLNTNLDNHTYETSLYVRNIMEYSIMGDEIYTVEVKFKVNKIQVR